MKPTEPRSPQGTTSTQEMVSVETRKGKMDQTSVVTSDPGAKTKHIGVKRKLSESDQVTGRAISVLSGPYEDFSESAVALHRVLSTGKGFQPQSFKLHFIGGSDLAAVVCMEPDINYARLFWHEFHGSGCKIILNINRADEGEEYYPRKNQELSFGKLKINREEVTNSVLLDSLRSKRLRTDPDNCHEHMKLKISGDLKFETELYRIKDWRDGRGYDPHRVITIARALPLGEVLIHCRAGLGRTGVMVAVMQLVDWADHHIMSPDKAVNTLVGFILGNRYDRADDQFVTSADQFNCLLQVVQILTGLSEQEITKQVQDEIKSRGQS